MPSLASFCTWTNLVFRWDSSQRWMEIISSAAWKITKKINLPAWSRRQQASTPANRSYSDDGELASVHPPWRIHPTSWETWLVLDAQQAAQGTYCSSPVRYRIQIQSEEYTRGIHLYTGRLMWRVSLLCSHVAPILSPNTTSVRSLDHGPASCMLSAGESATLLSSETTSPTVNLDLSRV
jgi:hypothetical protein